MTSATGLIARTAPSAMDVFNARSTSDERLRRSGFTTIFEGLPRALRMGWVTSARPPSARMWLICLPCPLPPHCR